jgi:hypothetical protein
MTFPGGATPRGLGLTAHLCHAGVRSKLDGAQLPGTPVIPVLYEQTFCSAPPGTSLGYFGSGKK